MFGGVYTDKTDRNFSRCSNAQSRKMQVQKPSSLEIMRHNGEFFQGRGLRIPAPEKQREQNVLKGICS